MAGVARCRGRAGPRAGRARHHSGRRRRGHRGQGEARADGPRADRRGLRPHRPHPRAAGLGARRASSASRMAAGCIGAPRRRTSPRPAIFWCCARPTRSSSARSARCWPPWPISPSARRRHADGRPHPRPARGARHLRLQGRGLDRRADAPCRAAAPGGAAPVRRHAGRRRRHLRLARQAGTAGAAGHRPPAGLRLDGRALARAGRSPGGEYLRARPARRDLRQDRARGLYADEDRVRRGRGAGAARHGRQLDHAAEAQSQALPGHHCRRGRGAQRWCRWRSRR